MSLSSTSIALATYQGARYLREQLESYAEQTRLPDELVISDEHSTDETSAVVAEFAKGAPFPVVFVENPGPRGIQRNFQNAAQHCSNEIILFSDQDDFWLPQHVQRLASLLEADQRILAVSSNSVIVDEKLNPKGYNLDQSERYPPRLHEELMRFPANQLELIVRQRISFGHGMAFRKSLAPFLLPFSTNCFHDWWVYLLAGAVGRVAYIHEPLTLYRTHERQAISGKKESVQRIAEKLKRTSAFSDESPAWRDVLERLRTRPQFAADFIYSEKLLAEKLQFVERRSQNRRYGFLHRAVATSLELFRGRYHRLGRGLVTYGRDLYGNR
jgi:glycosyltransferase involved in cell wall biosynthesis